MAHGHENCIPLNQRSKEVQRKIQQMGRDANKAKWEQIKCLRDAARVLLMEVVSDTDGKEVPIAIAMTLAQIKKALKGDTKAYKAVADVADEKQQKIDIVSSDGSMSPKATKIDLSSFTPEQLIEMGRAAFRGE
jgi:hypothetical protein